MRIFSIVGLLAIAISLNAETLFGPGSINIATNEAILINTIEPADPGGIYLDGSSVALDGDFSNPMIAIAGPHTLAFSNLTLVTFQRLNGSSIKTVVSSLNSTNSITIPSGKTIQFLPSVVRVEAKVHPQGSTNVYPIFDGSGLPHPAIAGPATIEITNSLSQTVVVSYYFTDEVLQLPPTGFLHTPAPTLEINIEKSNNLTNWIPVGAFNTEAETGAFYRLRILR